MRRRCDRVRTLHTKAEGRRPTHFFSRCSTAAQMDMEKTAPAIAMTLPAQGRLWRGWDEMARRATPLMNLAHPVIVENDRDSDR